MSKERVIPASEGPTLGPRPSLLRMLTWYMFCLCLPHVIIVALLMIPLSEPSKTWQFDQLPYVITVALAVGIVNHYPISVVNIYLPDIAPVQCSLEPLGIANAIVVAGLICGISYGVEAFPIVFMTYIVWAPFWVFHSVVTASRIQPRLLTFGHLSTYFPPSQRLACIAKLSMMPVFMSTAGISMMIIVVLFVSVSNTYHPSEWIAIGMELGLLLLTHFVRASIPWLQTHLFKFPLRSTSKFIHYQTELLIASFLHLAFPHLDGILKLMVILVTEVAQTVLSMLFLYKPYIDWLLHPESHKSTLLTYFSLTFRVIGFNYIQSPTPDSLNDDAPPPTEWYWLEQAKHEFFLRLWASANSTLIFLSMYTIANYSYNAPFYPFHFGDEAYLLTTVSSVIISTSQITVALVLVPFTQRQYGTTRPPLELFESGYKYLSNPKEMAFLTHCSVSVSIVAFLLFVKQSNCFFTVLNGQTLGKIYND
ncbi:Aste57867_2500 [Aphanomyces stellatus]|uniref:Aste57867_2500 protein n=1 Tax=Aphanomyces stellatus TaxID=120398 RepID=A0A485KCW2_9STRA|nr:hypothetical protein As57867_002493 [Aphanomyces stellatus]VFT79699.1 Aste57867_2500 [Aphanomyces stellatus]